jgi:hypothetical protein
METLEILCMHAIIFRPALLSDHLLLFLDGNFSAFFFEMFSVSLFINNIDNINSKYLYWGGGVKLMNHFQNASIRFVLHGETAYKS